MSRLAAVRGAVGFLTRLPADGDERAWAAFRESPWAFPLVGYPVGVAVAVPLLVGLPAESAAVAGLAVVYGLTGIVHLDGVADAGDAAVVHGGPAERRDVLKDTTIGVGAVAAVGLVVVGLAFGLLAVARLPARFALAVVVASEVGAKFGMSLVAAVGTAAHEGLGSAFTARVGPSGLWPAALVALPAGLLGVPRLVGVAALAGAVVAGGLLVRWAERTLGGINGDVFGAANEFGRVVGLHAGVILWTVS